MIVEELLSAKPCRPRWSPELVARADRVHLEVAERCDAAIAFFGCVPKNVEVLPPFSARSIEAVEPVPS